MTGKFKKILIVSGSPKKDGNTALLIGWFAEGADLKGANIEIVNAAFLKYKASGCISCRQCQDNAEYGCVIDDDASSVLLKMKEADIIVMATPMYFFSASAQLKIIFDRMFALYKWDNDNGTFDSPLKGKTLVLLASAYESEGLDALEKPFKLTADYTGIKFASFLVPNAGVSGDLKKQTEIRRRAISFGERII